MFRILIFVLFAILSIYAVNATSKAVKYSHFEDFLRNLDSVIEVDVNDDSETSDSTALPYPTDGRLAKKLKDQETSCCLLGQLAGDKGYHCYVKFYANKILQRNGNRAHNRKLSFYGKERLPNYGENLMSKFEKCVVGRGYSFNRCCHIAAKERRKPHYNTYLKYARL